MDEFADTIYKYTNCHVELLRENHNTNIDSLVTYNLNENFSGDLLNLELFNCKIKNT